MSNQNTIFADGILDAAVHHGVARLTLAQLGGDGKPQASGQLVVPLPQLPHVINGLVALMKQIEARVKEAQANATPGQPAEPVPNMVPNTFRFG